MTDEAREGWRSRLGRRRSTIGTTDVVTDTASAARQIAALGDAGKHARALDRQVQDRLADFGGMSELTAGLALRYLERIGRPLSALTMQEGVTLAGRGYLAHQAVEADPTRYGSGPEVPVLGTLPDLRRGRPPQDLLNRVVKATRRDFSRIRAVPEDVWKGFAIAVTARTQTAEDGPRVLDTAVIDALLRFGWVLRQVDLRYGQGPPA